MRYSGEQLAEKCESVNRVNSAHNKLAIVLAEYFRQFEGKDVVTAGGKSLRANVKAGLPEIGLDYWRMVSTISLKFRFRLSTTEFGEVHVGYLDGTKLVSVEMPSLEKTDYAPANVENTFDSLMAAKRLVANLEKELADFV